MIWRHLPATSKQLRYLQRLAYATGRTFVPPESRGDAAEQIDVLLKLFRRGAARRRR